MKCLIKDAIDKKFNSDIDPVEAGKVTWSQCPDDLGVFTFDEFTTSYSPEKIIKGE